MKSEKGLKTFTRAIFMNAREAVAAGQFYPARSIELERTLEGFFSKTKIEPVSNAVICPHAGYAYSGRISALSTSRLVKAQTFIILSPNHTGLGTPISVSPHDLWKTPLGSVPVNRAVAMEIVKNSSAEFDELAHAGEHAVEVEIPFLQFLFRAFSIVPITIASQETAELLELGRTLASQEGSIAVIASGDFSHYVPKSTAERKDHEALELIKELKAEEFHSLVLEKNLSICGVSPFTTLLEYCKRKGMKKGKLLEYTTSAETTGDKSSVVGYASVIFQ